MNTTALLIALAVALSTALPVVIVVLRSWILGRSLRTRRTVRLEIDGAELELTDASPEEQARLIEVFLERHTPVEGGGDDRDR